MRLRSLVVVLTAVGGVGISGIAKSEAAEVRAGGAIDLTISGYVGFLAHGGDLDEHNQDEELSTGLDFSTDTEVHVLLSAEDEETGLEYGGTIEFAADTNDEASTDEVWLYVSGGFGEVRVGDEDGAVDESVLDASVVAAGTGGLDGDVIEEFAADVMSPSSSDTATKIRYYTPYFGPFQAGISYTPNADDYGDSLAPVELDIGDWVEAALVYEDEFDELSVATSLVGSWARVKDRDSDTFDGEGEKRVWTYFAGGTVELFGVEVGGGFGDENVGGLKRRYFNAGIGVELDPVTVSINHGQVLHTNDPDVGEPWNLVFSADTELLPGVVLAGDVAYFDLNLRPDADEPVGDGKGWVWVTRLEVAF